MAGPSRQPDRQGQVTVILIPGLDQLQLYAAIVFNCVQGMQIAQTIRLIFELDGLIGLFCLLFSFAYVDDPGDCRRHPCHGTAYITDQVQHGIIAVKLNTP